MLDDLPEPELFKTILNLAADYLCYDEVFSRLFKKATPTPDVDLFGTLTSDDDDEPHSLVVLAALGQDAVIREKVSRMEDIDRISPYFGQSLSYHLQFVLNI